MADQRRVGVRFSFIGSRINYIGDETLFIGAVDLKRFVNEVTVEWTQSEAWESSHR